jgi:molecular chaperone IbpA
LGLNHVIDCPISTVAWKGHFEMRTAIDFTPYRRSMVGFDRVFDVLENATRGDLTEVNYPPYDIERAGDDSFRITLAVAGFAEDEIEMTAQQNLLIVAGRKAELTDEDSESRYIHRGIATRAFERRFQLADYVQVKGANLANGLLSIDLVREVPEAMKPRRVAIGGATVTKITDGAIKERKAA